MSRRALSVDFWLANGRSCKMSVSAGGGYLDDVVRFRDGKVHIGVVGAPPHTRTHHAHAATEGMLKATRSALTRALANEAEV